MMGFLVEKYRTGMITDDHLVVESLHMIDPENPGLVLSSLPENILLRMLRFVNECADGAMVTNYGIVPARGQVLAAKHWIEKSLLHQKCKTI